MTLAAALRIGSAAMVVGVAALDAPATSGPASSGPGGVADVDATCRSGEVWDKEVGCVVLPTILKKTTPQYPKRARQALVTARVVVKGLIGPDGRVTDISIESCDRPGWGFEKAAERAVAKWRYRPATTDGRAIAIWFAVTVQFTLR
jgi:protein TonB